MSTKIQAEEGYAGEGHLHELREHMKATGHRIVEDVPDDPGEKCWMHERPGIRRIKELARVGEMAELRVVEDEAAASRRIEAARESISSYSPVHAQWYADLEAVMPWEVLTHAAGPEDRRRAYRRHGARFEVDGEGSLTLMLDLNLDGGVMNLTSTR